MNFGKLYGPPSHPRVQKSLIIAEFNNIKLEITPNFEFGTDNKKSEYLKKFPLGQTPAFEGADGLLLTESAGIAFHLCQTNKDTTLLGKNANELAKIWQFVLYIETSFTDPAFKLFKSKFLNLKITDEEEKDYTEALNKCLTYLNSQLLGKKYLVGDCISFADINLICNICLIYSRMISLEMRLKFSNLTEYYENLIKLNEFKKYLGEIK